MSSKITVKPGGYMGRVVVQSLESEKFPVDFPFSGNFPETIPARTASTAIYFPIKLNFLEFISKFQFVPQNVPQNDFISLPKIAW